MNCLHDKSGGRPEMTVGIVEECHFGLDIVIIDLIARRCAEAGLELADCHVGQYSTVTCGHHSAYGMDAPRPWPSD